MPRRTWRKFMNDGDKYVTSHIYAMENEAVNTLFAEYQRAYHNMAIALEATQQRYGAGETWSANDAQFRQRTETLLQQITQEMRGLTTRTADITLKAAMDSYYASYYGRGWITDMVAPGPVDIPLIPVEAVRAAIMKPYEGSTFVDRFRGRDEEFSMRIRKSIVQSQINGETMYQAQKRIANELGLAIDRRTQAAKQAHKADFNRTQMIARTEIIRTSSLGSLAVYEQNKDVLKGWTWQAARDDRVCFPGWVKVTTANGDKAIQDIVIGDFVLTRDGYKRVVDTMHRQYSGAYSHVATDTHHTISTSNHRFWTNRGWIRACNLLPSDGLQTLDNQVASIVGVNHFSLPNTNYFPAVLGKIINLAFIARRVLMPIATIDFKSDSTDGEIDRIAPGGTFLNIFDPNCIKAFTGDLLKRCFAVIFTPARETAKRSGIARSNSKFFAACFTSDKFRRAAASLRAMFTTRMFGAETLTANNAVFIQRVGAATLNTASSVSIGGGLKDAEIFTANRARFGYALACIGLCIALAGAINIVVSGSNTLKFLAAPFTIDSGAFVSGLMVAICGAVLTAFKVGTVKLGSAVGANLIVVHDSIISRADTHYQCVYDITVEDAHEFYADGILVHNCDECADEDGQDHLFSEHYSPPPKHVMCRCASVPFFGERDLDDLVRGDVPSFKEWAATKGIDQSRFGNTYNLKAAKPPKSKGAT